MKIETNIHTAFKLQGNSFNSINELIDFSEEVSLEVQLFLKDWFDGKLYVEVKTSGSTGKPKLIKLQKTHMINSAKATGEYFNLFENTKALLCMSPNFIAGKMMLVRAMVLGWDLDVVEAVSNPLYGLDREYDFCAMVPIQLHNSLNEIHKVNKLIVGGGVVSKELLHKMKDVTTDIFATYGMTETVTHIAVKKLNNLSGSVSHYHVLPKVSISTDERECLVINAPTISNIEVTTNDVVKLISSTEFEWLGRFDSIINSGGIKLIPEQIELKISELLTNRFFVAGFPDAILGERLVLIVEGEIISNLIKNITLLKLLSKFEIPKDVYFIDKFIETPTQKINRSKTLEYIIS